MIKKTKAKNDYGQSYDHEFVHRLTGAYARIIKVYEYSGLVSGYEPTDTWRVDYSDGFGSLKTEFWGEFGECKSYAIKKLQASMPFKKGDYVVPNKKYFVEWDKNHVNEFSKEVFDGLKADELKRVFKVTDIFRNGKIEAKFVFLNEKNKPTLGATFIDCHYTDFDKTTINESWNNLLDIKEALRKAEEDLRWVRKYTKD